VLRACSYFSLPLGGGDKGGESTVPDDGTRAIERVHERFNVHELVNSVIEGNRSVRSLISEVVGLAFSSNFQCCDMIYRKNGKDADTRKACYWI
jgi:hypothetical protein